MAFLSSQSNAAEQQAPISYVKEAFKIQYNLIALAGAIVFAFVSGSFLPVILAGGVELMYLATVPHNIRFQRLVRSWKLAEQQKKRQRELGEMLRTLPSEMQSRYVHSAQVCSAIRSNFTQFSSTSQIFLQQIDARLQGLLSGYTRLLLAAAQQQQYMRSTDPGEFKREIAGLQKTMTNDPPRVQEINQKRIEILGKRQEKFARISENRKVVDAQLSAVEDVLMLVRDQSVTMRDPQQVSDRLDSLVRDVEQTEQTVQQVEAIFSDLSPDLDGLMSFEDSAISSSSGPERIRVSN